MSKMTELSGEQRFHLLMEAACDYAIFFTDVDGSIREWSTSAERIIGYSEAEALQMNGRDIFTAEDRARQAPEREMETAAREGQADDERWHVRKEQTLFFAIGRLVALRDDEGELVGFAKIIRDATPHKMLEQALKASEEQFRSTFKQAPIGMVLTDLNGCIQQVNAAFAGTLGLRDGELQGRQLLSFTFPEDRPAAEHQLQEMLTGAREHVSVEKRMMRSDGSLVWVQNSAALLHGVEGQPQSVIDLVQDISPLKRSEAELSRRVDERTHALREKSAQMEAFCYTVAHDLRAPLRAISSYAKFLGHDYARNLPGEGQEYLRRIEAAAGRLDCLISDLLGYTRMQQVPIQRELVDLTGLVANIAEQTKRDHPGIAITITVDAPLGGVRADVVTLEHVFLNLFSNAVKFRREGVIPRIHVRSELRDCRRRVWVEDNGIGIDPRFSHRVFGMFERVHPERKIPGTGVGLAIVATAIERLGGTRGVEPNEPAGSRFWIELPTG